MLARPRVTSWRKTFQPRATSHLETKSTAPPSAPVEESMLKSSAASATTSVMPAKLAGPARALQLAGEHPSAQLEEVACERPTFRQCGIFECVEEPAFQVSADEPVR